MIQVITVVITEVVIMKDITVDTMVDIIEGIDTINKVQFGILSFF